MPRFDRFKSIFEVFLADTMINKSFNCLIDKSSRSLSRMLFFRKYTRMKRESYQRTSFEGSSSKQWGFRACKLVMASRTFYSSFWVSLFLPPSPRELFLERILQSRMISLCPSSPLSLLSIWLSPTSYEYILSGR